MNNLLSIQNISIRIDGKKIVNNVSLEIHPQEIHALMGPNGSGKSSLAYAVAGHPLYEIARGDIFLGDQNIKNLKPEERARAGLFLSFQEPPEVGGVTMDIFLKTIGTESRIKDQASRITDEKENSFENVMRTFGLSQTFSQRFLNEGFSGGEKKKSELLQLLARNPKIAILDEIDTGLDVDALDAVAQILQNQARAGCGLLIISHSPRLLKKIDPDFVHVMLDGRLAASGKGGMLDTIETVGYHFSSRVSY